MAYRNDLDALVARKTALEEEVRDRTRELDSARRLVDEIEARARLPVLDNIRVAAPCSARWDAMIGDDRARACGDCKKTVYNLSEMTRDEAETLIRDKEGRLCVRYFQRADGTIMLKDCIVGVKRRRRRRIVAAGVAASIAGSAFGYTRTRARAEKPPVTYLTVGELVPEPIPPAVQVTMGAVVMLPESTRETNSMDGVPVLGHLNTAGHNRVIPGKPIEIKGKPQPASTRQMKAPK